MEFASKNWTGLWDFEVAPTFKEILCILDLYEAVGSSHSVASRDGMINGYWSGKNLGWSFRGLIRLIMNEEMIYSE
jgi:hypothetical protein